jgi:phage terminase large subunit-like protein
MISFTHEGTSTDGKSPDRVDAMVYAATDLFGEITAKRRNNDKPLPTRANRMSPFKWRK